MVGPISWANVVCYLTKGRWSDFFKVRSFFTIFFFRNVYLLAITFCFQKDFPKAARLSGLRFFGFFIREIRGYLDCTITFINYFH